jgi:enediyne biosynthesis protein E4
MKPACNQEPSRYVASVGMLLLLTAAVGCGSPKPEVDRAASTRSSDSNEQSSDALRSVPSVSPPPFLFEEQPQALSGSPFRDGHEAGLYALPETTGGGMAVADFDCDGRLDWIGSGGGYPDLELRVLKGHRGSYFRARSAWTYTECSQAARLDFSSTYHSGIVAADYDNDGLIDLLVTGYGPLQLFHNLGDGTFEEMQPFEDARWSSGAAFMDIEGDGDLDLYVVRYADWSFDNNPICPSQARADVRDYCGPTDFRGLRDSLYENLGNGGFRDVTDRMGTDAAYRGLGVIAADLDGDRDIDLYVANDVEPNLLYRNDGAWNWTEMGRRAGVSGSDLGRPEGSMGIAIGDYNGDERLDLWVTNYQNELCALYRNQGNLSFGYASHGAKIAATDERAVGWGTAMVDLDLDGDEDILIANGHLERHSQQVLQKPQVLENVGGKRFALAKFVDGFFSQPQAGRGLATADLDADGRMDFGMTRVNADLALVRNTTLTKGRYLSLRLIGVESNRDAIGTTVRLKCGGSTWVRHVYGGGSYASTSDRAVHFGLPEALGEFDGSLEIAWPNGRDQILAVSQWNQTWVVLETEEGLSNPFHE